MISVLILTRNEQRDLPDCLASVSWSDDIHVFDSHSTDTTILPHIDWRIADYSYSGAGITQDNITRHPQTISTGIVLRF